MVKMAKMKGQKSIKRLLLLFYRLLFFVFVIIICCGCKLNSNSSMVGELPNIQTETTKIKGNSVGDIWLRPIDGMVMVYVPAGEFEMGSNDEAINYALQMYDEYGGSTRREDFEREQPAHTVVLDEYWIDQTKVTNAQFATFLNERGNRIEGGATWLDLEERDCLIEYKEDGFRPENGYENHPVMEVSWYGAAAYCEWVGGRLPTEAEWEYAARGPEGRVYPWGDTLPTCEQAQFYGCVPAGTVPVDSFRNSASWCNAQDLGGNVWEWVADWFGEYSTEKQVNPIGPATGRLRGLRGGSWGSKAYVVRSAFRYRYAPYVTYNLGFRCVKSIK